MRIKAGVACGSAALLAACCIVTVTPAMAQEPVVNADDQMVMKVSYADLDLTTPAGGQALDRRLAFAVRKVCGDADMRDLSGWTAQGKCRAETQARTLAARSTILASKPPASRTVEVAAR